VLHSTNRQQQCLGQDMACCGAPPHQQEGLRQRLLMFVAFVLFFSMGIGTAPTSLSCLLFLLLWLGSGVWLRGFSWWCAQPWLVPVLLLLLLPATGLLWTIDPEPKVFSLLHRSHYWLCAGAIAGLAGVSTRIRQLCLALIVGVELIAVMFIATRLGIIPEYTFVQKLVVKSYINYSLLLVLVMLLLSFLFCQEPDRRLRVTLLAVMLIDIFVLALLKGRGGYLAFVLLSPVMFLNLVGWRRWFLALVCSLVVVSALLISPTVRERVSLIVKESHQFEQGDLAGASRTSVGQRLIFWQGALRIIAEYPLLGVGTGGYPEAMKRLYPEETGRFTHPHNYYLVMATQYGVTGLAIFCWLYWVTVRRAWQYRHQWSGFAVLAVFAVLGIGSLTDATLQAPQTGILFALMAGLPMGEP